MTPNRVEIGDRVGGQTLLIGTIRIHHVDFRIPIAKRNENYLAAIGAE